MSIAALDHMLENDLTEYNCDPWHRVPGDSNYASVKEISGQIKYNNEIFVVSHHHGSNGKGGQDQGSPPSVKILKVVM